MFDRAIAAGAKEIFPVKDQFYGHRAGRVVDPFGYVWIITTEIEKVFARRNAKADGSLLQFSLFIGERALSRGSCGFLGGLKSCPIKPFSIASAN